MNQKTEAKMRRSPMGVGIDDVADEDLLERRLDPPGPLREALGQVEGRAAHDEEHPQRDEEGRDAAGGWS